MPTWFCRLYGASIIALLVVIGLCVFAMTGTPVEGQQFRNTGFMQPGAGTPTVTIGADPAAGVEVSVTVPAREYWRIRTVRVELVTSATAANRVAKIVFDNGTTEFARAESPANHAASLTRVYMAGFGYNPFTMLEQTHAMPIAADIVLGPTYRIRTVTTAIQAGDNYGAPAVHYELYRR